MNKIIKKNFSDIEILYNIFFFDLYGVTHNGVRLFPNILNILRNLKELNKIVVFISNAPRKSVKIKKFLTSIGLEGRLGHRPSQLSGGERQRVAVIRGLINKPSVLLLDEPTGNLDSDSAKKTLDLILQLSKTLSMAIVLVTHDTFVAKNMDVTYRLMDGRLEEK